MTTPMLATRGTAEHLNRDGWIDGYDLAILATYFGDQAAGGDTL